MIVEPEEKRHHAIQKVNLDLKTLEETTYKALSSFFSDKESPANKSKKPLLEDIFRIARQEARYRDGEISEFDILFNSHRHPLALFSACTYHQTWPN